ncbi:aldose epimerase family protein [Allocoleopsis franciscana]|uniref:Galactose mutarotase-like enzyme n=1 Tax=Allocoleopsis franciscana PCC 7113 TaxID=1173027 RepID=K9WMY8_9CYAN|nr:galactose mutarotase [Allocoleopsis franciscana]AFZ21156.1 galactose mutarotase-like enzyme [Allocoleopsis franciscana PCC 7113]
MCAIAIEQKQYKTYILTNPQSQSRLEVVPERGAIITQWSLQQQDILYLDRNRFADPNLSVRGGIPILFPICGNLPNNTYTHKGQSYQLKQHGFARDLPWQVIQSSEANNNLESLTLVLNSDDQTRAVYPFDFQLAFTYKLIGNALEIHQRYTNHSDQPMPFSTGLHPYFVTSDKTQLEFEISASEYQDQITKEVHSFLGTFDLSRDELDLAFGQVAEPCASITDQGRDLKISLSYSDLYSTLVFWTVKGKDFYCLEPWSAPRNALNTGEHLTELPPGESLETSVTLEVTFL